MDCPISQAAAEIDSIVMAKTFERKENLDGKFRQGKNFQDIETEQIGWLSASAVNHPTVH